MTFEALVDHVISVPFLRQLQELGFRRVVVQYGNHIENGTNISKQYFSQVLEDNRVVEELDLDLNNVTNDKSVTTFANNALELQVFAFSPDIASYIANADIVVSHAGTGSILDALRMHKPLLVVTNLQLMDDHQEEVAAQFESNGHLYRMSTEELGKGKLEALLGEFRAGKLTFAKLPDPLCGVVESVIAEEALRA